jgi:di/tripeptidase
MGIPMIITGTDCHGGHTSKEHMILSSMQDYFELISRFILDCYKEKK